jgi:hypothetical protein
MRWVEPKVGDVRIRSRFLLEPAQARNPATGEWEWRWFERATSRQELRVCKTREYWADLEWIDAEGDK